MKQLMVVGLFLISLGVFADPLAKVSVRVVDEVGNPITNADVTVSFDIYRDRKVFEGQTDTNGLFSAESTTMPHVSLLAEKKGFYMSGRTVMFKMLNDDQTRYEPWNETYHLTLRPKKDVKEMTRKLIDRAIIPNFGTAIGFDLEKGDWVAPYGTGVSKDFIFTAEKENGCASSYILSFSNGKDGIQECQLMDTTSIYRWPYEAPLDGYMGVLKKEIRYSFDKKVSQDFALKKDSDVNYIFRVRTKCDQDGNVVSALYGKIRGELKMLPRGNLHFQYWLNTDSTSRSLESKDAVFP